MPVFESDRKIQKVGSSLAITIPAMFAKANEVEKGDELQIYYNLSGVFIASRFNDSKKLIKIISGIINGIEEKKDSKKGIEN